MKKHLLKLFFLCLILFTGFNVNAQEFPDEPPIINDPNEGGGAGSHTFGSLIAYSPSTSGAPSGTDGFVGIVDQNGPYFSSSIDFSINSSLSQQNIDLFNFAPSAWPWWSGGMYNDYARSTVFTGNLAGRRFIFYDDQNQNLSDDWCEVYFKQSPPYGQGYYLWTFERSYSDAYVTVTYHSNNGLDGKVSYIAISN